MMTSLFLLPMHESFSFRRSPSTPTHDSSGNVIQAGINAGFEEGHRITPEQEKYIRRRDSSWTDPYIRNLGIRDTLTLKPGLRNVVLEPVEQKDNMSGSAKLAASEGWSFTEFLKKQYEGWFGAGDKASSLKLVDSSGRDNFDVSDVHDVFAVDRQNRDGANNRDLSFKDVSIVDAEVIDHENIAMDLAHKQKLINLVANNKYINFEKSTILSEAMNQEILKDLHRERDVILKIIDKNYRNLSEKNVESIIDLMTGPYRLELTEELFARLEKYVINNDNITGLQVSYMLNLIVRNPNWNKSTIEVVARIIKTYYDDQPASQSDVHDMILSINNKPLNSTQVELCNRLIESNNSSAEIKGMFQVVATYPHIHESTVSILNVIVKNSSKLNSKTLEIALDNLEFLSSSEAIAANVKKLTAIATAINTDSLSNQQIEMILKVINNSSTLNVSKMNKILEIIKENKDIDTLKFDTFLDEILKLDAKKMKKEALDIKIDEIFQNAQKRDVV